VARTAIASLIVALALAAVPALAPAQDPGSTQYQDPLAGNTGSSSGGGSSGGGGGGGTTRSPGTTAATTQAAGDPEPTTSPAREQLPHTGLDAWLLVAAGAALLGGGLALRRTADRATR
jgi:LPXTG-motif cell wall-anchored protein